MSDWTTVYLRVKIHPDDLNKYFNGSSYIFIEKIIEKINQVPGTLVIEKIRMQEVTERFFMKIEANDERDEF